MIVLNKRTLEGNGQHGKREWKELFFSIYFATLNFMLNISNTFLRGYASEVKFRWSLII